jgi:hypothetical protein
MLTSIWSFAAQFSIARSALSGSVTPKYFVSTQGSDEK